MFVISEVEKLKAVYAQIIQGVSFSEPNQLYIKHLNELENSQISQKKISIYEKYLSEGLPSEQEKIVQLIESEQWDNIKEEEILNLRYFISDNEKNLKNIIIPQQNVVIKKTIENAKTSLASILHTRKQLIGRTSNEVAEIHGFNYFLYLSLYKDENCKIRLFDTFNDFQELEDDEIIKYINLVDSELTFLSEDNIRKISVLPFFINGFSYCKDNLYNFLNKPISELTHFQILLFSLGSRNINILSNSEGEPPDLLGDKKIEDVVLWFDQRFSIIQSKRNSTK